MAPGTRMVTEGALARLRLLQLVSPALPIGGYTYSQGIEWAVEAGWVRGADDLEQWLQEQLSNAMRDVDLPVLLRMIDAIRRDDPATVADWIERLLAWRETAELRAEESQRGRALADLLVALGVLSRPASARQRPRGRVGLPAAEAVPVDGGEALGEAWYPLLARSQSAGFAAAAVSWGVGTEDACLGFAWAWCETLVSAGVRLVPLGQSDGQRILLSLAARIPAIVAAARGLDDDDLGAASPAAAIAGSAHETQYTRLFRS